MELQHHLTIPDNLSLIFNPITTLFASFILGLLSSYLIQIFKPTQENNYLNFINDKTKKKIGVLFVGNLIKTTPLKYFNTRVYLNQKKLKNNVTVLKIELKLAKNLHLLGFYYYLLILTFLVFIKIDLLSFIIHMSLNILFNLYVALHLQYQINRLEKLYQ